MFISFLSVLNLKFPRMFGWVSPLRYFLSSLTRCLAFFIFYFLAKFISSGTEREFSPSDFIASVISRSLEFCFSESANLRVCCTNSS